MSVGLYEIPPVRAPRTLSFGDRVAIALRDVREQSDLTQREAARLSLIGEKSISSWETGKRTLTMDLSQLRALLRVYKITPAQFFALPILREDGIR